VRDLARTLDSEARVEVHDAEGLGLVDEAAPAQTLIVARRPALPGHGPGGRKNGHFLFVRSPGGLGRREALELAREVLAPAAFDDPRIEPREALRSAERLENRGEKLAGGRMHPFPLFEQGKLEARGLRVVGQPLAVEESRAPLRRERTEPGLEFVVRFLVV